MNQSKYKFHHYPKAIIIALALIIVCIVPGQVFADEIWSAVYVAAGFQHFWYLVFVTIIVEAVVIYMMLKVSVLKASMISIAANTVSSTFGLYLALYGMILWQGIVDSLFGSSSPLNQRIGSLVIMFAIGVLIELLLVRIIWKYPFKKTILCLSAGNFLSYAVITVYLFCYGGWDKVL
jgi:hypothetical protein